MIRAHLLLMCWAEEQDLPLRYSDAYAQYMRLSGAFFSRPAR